MFWEAPIYIWYIFIDVLISNDIAFRKRDKKRSVQLLWGTASVSPVL